MDDRGRLPAHCPLCGTPTHEIVQWANGEPARIGALLPGMVRVSLILVSGRTADVRVCGDCAAGIEGRLPELWSAICRRFAFEHRMRPLRGGRPPTEAQAALVEADTLRVIHDVPIGVLAREVAV